MDIIHTDRSSPFPVRNSIRQQIHTIWRCSDRSWIRNVKQSIINAEGSLQFFREFHDHSAYIAKIIQTGFGKQSGILGDCKYHNGLIQIQKPKEPEITHIGLARKHLQEGYQDIWKLKTEAESDSDKLLANLEKVKISFESKVTGEMERETDQTHTKLIRKNYLDSLSEIFQSSYYNELISEIFYEIEIRKLGKQPRELYPSFGFAKIPYSGGKEEPVYKLSFGKEAPILVAVKEEMSGEIKSRIEKLLLDSELTNMVSKFTELKNSLDTNQKRKEYFKKIDNLYKTIYLDGESLNKKIRCNLCPL